MTAIRLSGIAAFDALLWEPAVLHAAAREALLEKAGELRSDHATRLGKTLKRCRAADPVLEDRLLDIVRNGESSQARCVALLGLSDRLKTETEVRKEFLRCVAEPDQRVSSRAFMALIPFADSDPEIRGLIIRCVAGAEFGHLRYFACKALSKASGAGGRANQGFIVLIAHSSNPTKDRLQCG